MSKSAGSRTNRNLLNLTLPTNVSANPASTTTSGASITSSGDHSIDLQNGSFRNVAPVAPIMRIRDPQQPAGNNPRSSAGLHVKVVAPEREEESPGGRPVTSNRYSNRLSTGPIDAEEVLKRLKAQDLDDLQRRELMSFVTEKQKIGELRPEDFEKIRELGKGNGGVVSQVRHVKTDLIMAKKNIHLEIKPTVRSQIIRELQVLHDCNSPYIVGYYGAYFADGDISLLMEYMNGGSLDIVLEHAGRIPEPIVAKIVYSVLRGLVYLGRTLCIIHRDVKPSNILVKMNGDVKLCDFGVSGQLTDSLANSFVGTRSYMSPERLTGEQYNIQSDVWSVGLSLVELTTGRYPIPSIEDEQHYLTAFSSNRDANLAEHLEVAKHGRPLPPVRNESKEPMAIFELLAHIVDQPAPRLPHFCFSEDLIDLVDKCLKNVASDRPSLDTLLRHPFVTTVAGACPTGLVHRQSTVYDIRDSTTPNDTTDPIDIGRYLAAVLPQPKPD